MTQSAQLVDSLESKPQNGLKGLRHWRQDLLAGLVVSLVSLPLSSGIAIASGAPPIYGIISSIIAGLVFPFIGGSYVTISGPAAGLAPALLATMAALGGAGDADHVGDGYGRLLVVIFLVGCVQVVLARLKLARFAAIFPASVVEGMLVAIGILILVKALPLLFGFLEPIHAHGFTEYLNEIPTWVGGLDTSAVTVGAVSLFILFACSSKIAKRLAAFRTVPPHLYAAIGGGVLAAAIGLKPEFLIEVPANPLDGIQLPHFGSLFGDPSLYGAALVGLITLTLIDGVESLATAQAIDRVDPFRRKSQPNRVLASMGVSNMLSSIIGGLTIIPGGVKSKTCIEAGGRTLWANFANAVFLIAYLFVAASIVSMLPKATLGAILVYTGWKMAHPRIAKEVAHVGVEQLFLFVFTVVITLATDLLIGVLAGTLAKLVILTILGQESNRMRGRNDRHSLSMMLNMFRDPVSRVEREGDLVRMNVSRPLVSFNAYKLLDRFDTIRPRPEAIEIRLMESVDLLDHTAADGVFAAMDAATPDCPLRLVGLESLSRRGADRSSLRIRIDQLD